MPIPKCMALASMRTPLRAVNMPETPACLHGHHLAPPPQERLGRALLGDLATVPLTQPLLIKRSLTSPLLLLQLLLGLPGSLLLLRLLLALPGSPLLFRPWHLDLLLLLAVHPLQLLACPAS